MKKILVLGGDFRQIVLAKEFKKSGHEVLVFGFDSEYTDNIKCAGSLSEAVSESDVIIMGLPATKDDITVNTPLYKSDILLDEVISDLRETTIIFGGMITENLKSRVEDASAKVFDYYEREELIVKNVVPTVEAAIAIAVNETAITLKDSKCLVVGYGRIGKYLSKILQTMGAEVTVCARKCNDLSWIGVNGYKPVHTGDIKKCAPMFDVIINTVPSVIIDRECIDNIKRDAVIIDLASKPGGTDINYAKQKGINTIWALSLPGKTAPVTAGKIIKETVENILYELGV